MEPARQQEHDYTEYALIFFLKQALKALLAKLTEYDFIGPYDQFRSLSSSYPLSTFVSISEELKSK